MSVEGSVSRNLKNNSQHDAIPAGANVADDRASAWGAPGPNRRLDQNGPDERTVNK
jgi:hypothetical protein